MAKVEFAMKDSVLRRAKEQPGTPAGQDAGAGGAAVAGGTEKPQRRKAATPRPDGPAPAAETQIAVEPEIAPAKPVRQTSVTLPVRMWEEITDLTEELAGEGIGLRQQELLVAVLRYHAPASVESAAELFETYLELAPSERHAGEETEERNFRLPTEVRSRLSEQADVLRKLSRDANRGTLIAATWRLHGPRNERDARELLALLRKADLRRALRPG